MWISGTAWRAKVHLAALHAAVDEFREKSPYAFAMESPGNERWKPGIPITVTVDRPDNAIHLQRKVDDSYANGYGNSKWASEGAAA
jgi:hypothetical protein